MWSRKDYTSVGIVTAWCVAKELQIVSRVPHSRPEEDFEMRSRRRNQAPNARVLIAISGSDEWMRDLDRRAEAANMSRSEFVRWGIQK